MDKIDLTKQHKSYYTAKTQPHIIDVEPANFLSITGKGDPSSQNFVDTIQALYSTAYTIKFMYKSQNKDFVVAKLEGLWWFDTEKYKVTTMEEAPKLIPRSEWEYRLLIRMPDFVSDESVELAKQQVVAKKNIALAETVSLCLMNEGKCVQMLHIGSFDSEPVSLQKINAFMVENGWERNGLHHEIYLSDFRKTPPEKLRTILREPVK